MPDGARSGHAASAARDDLEHTGRLEVRLVGRGTVLREAVVLEDAAVGSRKARLLLRLLAARAGSVPVVDDLVAAIWGERVPRAPVDNLATLVSRLRASLGAAVVSGDRGGWSLGAAVDVDVERAATLVTAARMHARADEPALALSAAEAAAGLLAAGDVLADDGDAPWAEAARSRAAMLRRDARLVAATAALAVGDSRRAAELAGVAAGADPFDEEALRLQMRAYRMGGRTARALAEYDALRRRVVNELGVEPDPVTQALYLDLLRDPAVGVGAPSPASARQGTDAHGLTAVRTRRAPTGIATGSFAGRDEELARLRATWTEAVAGTASVVLLAGEGGIGKTRLASEVAALAAGAGGLVLQARCYQAEQSLLLQPLADAIRPQVVELDPAVLRQLSGESAPWLAMLVPEAAALTDSAGRGGANPDTERRMVYEAVLTFLRRLGERRPVLLLLDDLHEAALATLEVVRLLARHLGSARVLVVGTVRIDEGPAVTATLADVATTIVLGPLPPDAVRELAAAAGRREQGDPLATRTRGHPLFVVEALRALEAGEPGIPASLAEIVAERVHRTGPDGSELVEAAGVLGSSFAPADLAAMLGWDELAVARACERLAAARLLVRSGAAYEFANDLMQEIVYAGTPRPVRDVLHTRAAELLREHPEAAARHAAACERWDLAARAWLSAGVDAVSRYAADDGIRMFALAAQAAARAGDDGCAARAHLERGRAGTSRGRFSEAFEDFRVALDMAVRCGSSQLELDARRELAGDVLVGLGRPISDCQAELDAALVVARAVGDAAHEADLLARSAVVSANRLQFGRAIADGRRSVEIARQTGDPQILAIALDGLKNPFAYTGQIAELESTLAEVEPLVRLAHDVFRIQWCVFEHGFVPLATGRWDEARAAVEAALTLNRESGWTAFESWFLSHLGWVARLDGRLDDAVEHGRRAVRLHQQGSHPWWSSTAYAMLAGSLLAQGGAERRTEAAELLRHGLDAAGRSGVEAFRLRCVAVLAEATGDEPSRNEAQRMFARVSAPAGVAWMHGVDAYVALGRAWLDAGRADRAAELLAPVAAAARTSGWSALFQAAGGADLLARAASSDARQAGGVRGARSDQLGEAGGDPVGGAGGDR